MNGAVQISLIRFLMIYLLLLLVLAVMKKCRIRETKLLVVSSVRMTVQLVLAGLILTYIFANPHPAFTVIYILVMDLFAVYRVISKNKGLNRRFQAAIAGAMSLSGFCVLAFFVLAVVNQDIFNPQYAIPLSGMLFGNAMTGVNLGIKGNAAQRHKKATLSAGFGRQCGKSLIFTCGGNPSQATRQRLSAKIRFANANIIFSLAVCFRRPRYRVFR